MALLGPKGKLTSADRVVVPTPTTPYPYYPDYPYYPYYPYYPFSGQG